MSANLFGIAASVEPEHALERSRPRSRLFNKFVLLFVALVGSALLASGMLELWFSYQENKTALAQVQQEKALAAAARIEQFIEDITRQINWTSRAQRSSSDIEQRRLEYLRLLSQAPAITEISHLDDQGREQLRISRLAVDVIESGTDWSSRPSFIGAKAGTPWFSPVYFRRESEPYMTVAMAGTGSGSGLTIAEVNLKFIWDVVSRIAVGEAGHAFVVDSRGWLIAHPDIGLVLRQSDVSGLPQVAAALNVSGQAGTGDLAVRGADLSGAPVLTAHAAVAPLDWTVFVELPLAEAFAPLYRSLFRTAALMLLGLSLAVAVGLLLARQMIGPIAALQDGATRIGRGDLAQRIDIRTGDELEMLADRFNEMAAQLQESYARLEHKVEQRTRELSESLQQQTATADVLKVISRSAFDLNAVLDTLAASAVRLCDSHDAIIMLKNGEWLNVGAHHGPFPLDFDRRPLTRGWTAGRAVVDRTPIHIHDLQAAADEFPEGHELALRLGHRSILSVPLLRGDEAIGVLVIRRTEVRPFTEKQIELVTTFADQAVIAIENIRLFEEVQTRNREVSEALEQQTATADILRVISSSPTDIQPVFDTIAESAARLCSAQFCFVFRFDGTLIHFVAHHGVAPAGIDAVRRRWPAPPGRASTTARAVLSGAVEQIPDVHLDPDYELGNTADIARYRSAVGVPMIRDGRAIGAITVARSQAGLFPDRQIELLKAFAEQAVIALENVRLFTELEARNRDLNEALEQQTATAEILSEISKSPTDIQPVFDMIAQSAARLCEAQFCFVADYDGALVHFAAQHGMPPETVEGLRQAYPMPPSRASVSARIVLTGRVEHVADLDLDPDYKLRQIDGRVYRSLVGIPMLKEGRPLGAVVVGRSQAGQFSQRHVKLLETFADQAVIAIENVRLFTELEARNRDLNEALQQQTATADVLKVISRSTFDLQAVLDTLVESSVRLCDAQDAIFLLRDGDCLEIAAHHGPIPAGYTRLPATRHWTGGRAVVDRKPVHVHDLHAAGDEFPEGQPVALKMGYRTILSIPLLRQDDAIGAITIRRTEVRPFTDKQINLLATFADQAVIAIENVRLFDQVHARTQELTEALEQQTATSEILRAISMSPSNVEPVFETIVRNAVSLCGGLFANVFRYDGELLHFAASDNVGPDYLELLKEKYPMQPDPTQVSGRVLLEKSVVRLEDALSDPGYDRRFPLTMGWRRMLGVPMLRDGAALGVIVVGWAEPGPVSQRQEDLLKTFADQAVIAVENVRLFDQVQTRTRELSEALEQQTATADVLKVISRSAFDLQAVLDTLVESAIRLCDAYDAVILLRSDDWLQLEAHHGPIPVGFTKRPLTRGWAGGRAVLDRQPVHVHDLIVAADEFPDGRDMAVQLGFRTVLSVPLLREDQAIGALTIRRTEVRPFTDKQVELLKTFADQAVIAVENVRLFDQVQTRTRELAQSVEELRALGEVSQAVNSTLDLETVLNTIVAKAVQLSGTDAGSIYVLNKAHTKFKLRATYGMDDATVAAIRHTSIRRGETVIGQATEQRQPVQIADIQDAPGARILKVVIQAGYRALLIVPLLGPDRAIGVLVIRRKVPGAFPDTTLELLQTFAAQSVLAIQNARLFHEIEEKSRELEVASRHKSQFLANMSHELRTPLNAILGYSELVLDDIYGAVPDKARAALERVQSNGKHLLGLINDVLDLAKIEAGRLTLSLADYSLNEVVAGVVAAVEALAAEKALALRLDVPADLPVGHGDEQRIRQVLLNLVSNAIKFTDAGEVAITARLADGRFTVSVGDTGPGISAEDQAKLFQDFHQADSSSTRKKGGTGLGLAISRRFVELQGGRIWVESEPGQGSTFAFELPVEVEHQEELA